MDRRFTNFNFRIIISGRNYQSSIDQDNKRIDIILTEENLSKAIEGDIKCSISIKTYKLWD